MIKKSGWELDQGQVDAILGARHGDPFSVLGMHETADGIVVRAFVADASSVEVLENGKVLANLARRDGAGLFEGVVPRRKSLFKYRLLAKYPHGADWEFSDPYAFSPVLGTMDDYFVKEGTHRTLYERFGAHEKKHEGVDGVHFAVWAPSAQRVSLVGDFNGWDPRRHMMRKRVDSGVWEIFIPELKAGAVYKYELIGIDGHVLPMKADPVGFAAEMRPATGSVVTKPNVYAWGDKAYLNKRNKANHRREAISIYEVHLGSWRRSEDGGFLSYDELADQLIPYAKWMGFTHIELLPVSEHPLDDSWGYQPIGLFAPSRRFGEPEGFAHFVDRAHQAGIGVMLDWVPAHFPTDVHGLANFDGTALYEHADPRRGFHPDWNTAIYDFGRSEVTNFLASNALYWLDKYHIDCLRVDAVASMLYLDYSRNSGEWLPNKDGGNENYEAVSFLRRFNELVYATNPGAMTIAEESTAWPGVSQPVYNGGLGFGFKWNMGWMHDTLDYMSLDPVYRKYHHHKMTFGLIYAFSENFVLPLSHDEVVHGKGSILGRMPGDEWQKHANARAYYAYMWAHPGKKLLFMGQEFGQSSEWNFRQSLDWHLCETPLHRGLQLLVRDLNHLYRDIPALHARDCEGEGFRWIVADDAQQSVYAWHRTTGADDSGIVAVSNFTPMVRENYRIGFPKAGVWREIMNSDAAHYGGGNVGNAGSVIATQISSHGFDASAEITIPPLATVYFQFETK